MKFTKVIFSLLIFLSINSFAQTEADLENQSFCRSFISDGFFGQPKTERTICITFKNGKLIDDNDTLAGKPPETFNYLLSNAAIFVERDGSWKMEFRVNGEKLTSLLGAEYVRVQND